MGTTADKLSYLNTTKSKIKDAINYDFNKITSSDTFRSYADKIYSMQEDYLKYIPKETKTGASVVATNAVPLKPNKMVIDGNYEQETTEPYTGGLPAPRPDWEEPVEVVEGNVALNIEGENKFNKDANVVGSTNCSYNYENGIYTITNTNNNNPSLALGLNLEAGNYVLNSSNYLSTSTQIRSINNNVMANLQANYQNKTFTIEEQSGRITFNWLSVGVGNTITLDLNTLKIKEGSTATSYTPYHAPITIPIPLNGNWLGKLPNGVKDKVSIDRLGNVSLVKNVGNVVLDGSENGWSFDRVLIRAEIAFSSLGIPNGKVNTTSPKNGISNYFTYGVNTENTIGIGNSSSTIYVKITNNQQTEAQFKEWLSTHNTELYYELAEPQTINLGKINLSALQDGDTITAITNIVTDIEIEYFKEVQ